MSGFARLPVPWALALSPLGLPEELSARGFCPLAAQAEASSQQLSPWTGVRQALVPSSRQ